MTEQQARKRVVDVPYYFDSKVLNCSEQLIENLVQTLPQLANLTTLTEEQQVPVFALFNIEMVYQPPGVGRPVGGYILTRHFPSEMG